MSKLRSYVAKEVFKAFVPAFMALLLIMLLGFSIQLLNEGFDVVRLGSLPHHIAAFCVPWVMPAAFLMAVIMAFARMAADNEIIAVRVGGVHLFQLMVPICIAGLILSGVAMYFNFQTVPRARRRIERLKYTAIKQMLHDKVALSAQKQFSFSPLTVQYEDYKNGKMHDVLILESGSGGFCDTIITAASGEIKEDHERPGYMNIALQECAITQLTDDDMGGKGTWNANVINLPVRVTSDDLSDIGEDVKHLNVRDLIARYKSLQQKVAEHPEHFQNPDAAEDELGDKIDEIEEQRQDIIGARKEKQKRLKRLEQQDTRKQKILIEQKENEIEETQETIEKLKEQRQSYTQELQELRDETDNEDDDDYEKITELQKKLRSTSEKLEDKQQIAEKAQSSRDVATARLRNIEIQTNRVKKDFDALKAEQEGLDEQLNSINKKRHEAHMQEDFRELRVRIHRRLALSFAILFFAIVGMPLGILTRNRSTMIAFGVGFAILILLFYPFLIFGQIAAEVGMLPVPVAMWSGNTVTFVIGMGLMIKLARR